MFVSVRVHACASGHACECVSCVHACVMTASAKQL